MYSGASRQQTTRALPCVTWIYDFQHLRLPDLFSSQQRQERDRLFRATARAASLVLVTSEAVRQDFARFAPEEAGKARAVNWVSDIPLDVYQQPLPDLLQTYHLPDRFFYLPNQFWVHKNHAVVWEALRLLAERGVRPCLVCTGLLGDERVPRHASDLFQKLSLWGLREQVIFLGSVPRQHVFGLMRQSVRVINPSLFEGLGLAVAECKSLGKSALLSDLPVLREQALPSADYFDPHDAQALAGLMELHWRTGAAGPDFALEERARHSLPARQEAFARDWLAIMQEAVRLWQPASAAGQAG
jgi:glycosyltransferase involved in cell wall biosynthesis